MLLKMKTCYQVEGNKHDIIYKIYYMGVENIKEDSKGILPIENETCEMKDAKA